MCKLTFFFNLAGLFFLPGVKITKKVLTLFKKIHRFIKSTPSLTSSFWYISANVLARGLTFIFTPIYTRLLSPSQFGNYSIYMSWLGIFTIITSFGIAQNAIYKGLSHYKNSSGDLIKSAVVLNVVTTFVAAVLYLIFEGPVNALTTLNRPLTLLLLAEVMLNTAEGIFLAYSRYEYNYKTVFFIVLTKGVLTQLFSTVLIAVLSLNEYGRVYGVFFSSLIIGLPLIIRETMHKNSKVNIDIIKYLVSYLIPVMPHYLALSLMAQSDKIILSNIVGREAVGLYSVISSFALSLNIVTGGITASLSTWITRKLEEHKEEKIKNAIKNLMTPSFILTLLFIAVSPEIVGFVYGREYLEAISSIYPLALSVPVSFMSGLISMTVLHKRSPVILTRNTLVSAAAGVVTQIILTERVGIIGAGAGMLVSQIILLAVSILSSEKQIIDKMEFSLKITSLLLLGILLFTLRNFFVSRLILIITMIIILFKNLSGFLSILRHSGKFKTQAG